MFQMFERERTEFCFGGCNIDASKLGAALRVVLLSLLIVSEFSGIEPGWGNPSFPTADIVKILLGTIRIVYLVDLMDESNQ